MPNLLESSPGEILTEASVADFIKALGLSIAEAQRALDENSVDQVAHFVQPRPALDGKSLLDLGLSPSFYHYQHADVAVALQISLRQQEETSVGLNLGLNVNNTSGSSGTDTASSSSTESGSSTRSSHREAQVHIAMSSQGALLVGGENFQLEGADPRERIADLRQRLRQRSSSGIERSLATHECAPVDPTVTPASPRIVTTPNTVTFLGGGEFSGAIIRISQNPAAAQTYTLKSGTSIDVPPAADVEAYANAVATAIQGLGYETWVTGGPSRGLLDIKHEHDEPEFDHDRAYRPDQDDTLKYLAGWLRDSGHDITLEGMTDTSGPGPYNERLGAARGAYVHQRLLSYNAPPGQLTIIPSRGEQNWRGQNLPDNTREEDHRIVDIRFKTVTDWFVVVRGDQAHPIVRTQVTPDQLGNPASGENGFVHVYRPQSGSLTGQNRRVDAGGQSFPLRGDAAGGHGADAAESYAANLAADINANQAANLATWVNGAVVHLCPRGSRWTLTLLTTESRDIQLSGTDDVTVTTQFTRTQSRSVTQERTSSTTVAVGVSLDVRYAKQYETNITGNSSIAARIVAIPAPPEFLATIKEYLS